MTEHPILFNEPMSAAARAGRKSQTRRVVRGEALKWLDADNFTTEYVALRDNSFSPYGYQGDRLWVREPWRVGKPHDKIKPSDILDRVVAHGQGVTVLYEAGGWQSFGPPGRAEPIYPDDVPMPAWAGKYRPSMFMPRWAARTLLEVTGVRVERLRTISEADMIAEGIERTADGFSVDGGRHFHAARARDSFASLWDSINAARGHSWDANPWVWVVEFRRVAA